MKTCKRLLDFIQIVNAEGDVRTCSWSCDNIIGNLQQQDLKDILNSDKAKKLRKLVADGDFSKCRADNCPYLANGNIKDILVDYNEEEVIYPESLYLAYEGNCNYNCTCCTSSDHMKATRCNDYSDLYEVLEEKVRPFLPYVKNIGANGRGELFASTRILKLLSEWEPIAPQSEISVELETNGSMFNKKNWERIKNLGKYNLSVAITVMSFDEDIYQYLSGTRQPIDDLISSLNFVKELREQGIINRLELATVMQEANYREMPEFTRRCIEEFGADVVRIRPIMPGGSMPNEVQWFMDVRNPKHPYYSLYCKVMGNEIFKNPKVLLWSNDLPSNKGDLLSAIGVDRLKKQDEVLKIIKNIISTKDITERLRNIIKDEKIAVYGLGAIGKVLVLSINGKVKIDTIFDEDKDLNVFNDIKIRKIEEAERFDGAVLITPYGRFEEMKSILLNTGFNGKVINIEELLEK